MLSLLIFIGEGVRDAFDPRKTVGPITLKGAALKAAAAPRKAAAE
jgi:microcin C transport system permease protein